MSVKIIDKIQDIDQYNRLAPNPLQSWEWGQARVQMGIEVLRIGDYEKEKIQHVYQITFHKIPYSSFTIGYLPRSAAPSSQVLDMILEEGKKRRAIFVKIEPYERKKAKEKRNKEKEFFQIRRSSHPLFPSWTQIIDLTQSEDNLLKRMHQKTRYNIRLAQKKGVEIKEMTNDRGFEIFVKLYFETCRRQGYRGHTPVYHKIVFENLSKKIAHIFVAFYQNTPLSAFEIFTFNDVAYYPYGGSSTEFRNVMAANLLMWEAIRFAKSLGCKLFDMWGSLPPGYNINSAWGGFTRFKEGYGGEFVELVGSYDLIINPLLYRLYNVIYKLRKRVI